jgi:hypothetical protein
MHARIEVLHDASRNTPATYRDVIILMRNEIAEFMGEM